jgi:micrococcal nuclease
MQTRLTILLPILFLLAAPLATAATFTGKVVSIADGDTITVLHDETQIKVRFHGVDTPEKKQDYGTAAKNFTADHCFGEIVTIVVTDTDRYGRKVGLVILEAGRVLNHELVAAGLAHWYEQYAPDDQALKRLQTEAKTAKRGLWSRSDVIIPSEFRKGKRNGNVTPYNPPSARTESMPSALPSAAIGPAGTVYITDSGAKYHKKGCRFLKQSSKAVLLSKARGNYDPCGVCKP